MWLRLHYRIFKTRIFILILTIIFSLNCSARDTTENIREIGNVLQIVNPLLGYALTIHTNTNDQYVFDYIMAIGITGLSKQLGNKIKYKQAMRPDGTTYKGMPSGHTTSAWLPAAHFRNHASDRLMPLAIPLYANAVFTGYSRVRSHRHTVLQVVASAVLCEAVVLINKRIGWFTTNVAIDDGVKINFNMRL